MHQSSDLVQALLNNPPFTRAGTPYTMIMYQLPYTSMVFLTMLLAACAPALDAHIHACHRDVTLRGDSSQQDEEPIWCSSRSIPTVADTGEEHHYNPSDAFRHHNTDTSSDSATHAVQPNVSLPLCRSMKCSATGQCSHKGHVCVCHADGHSFSFSCSWTGHPSPDLGNWRLV